MGSRTMWTVLHLVACIVLCQAAGAIGAFFTAAAIPTWYASLRKPSFTPPSWVFGPVWITLYLMMGIAAFLVWRRGWQNPQVKLALVVFAVQLLLNAIWSPVFFGMRWPLGGLVVIVALWLAIVVTIVTFFRVSTPAAVLLIPYILWVSYATALNFEIMRLNP